MFKMQGPKCEHCDTRPAPHNHPYYVDCQFCDKCFLNKLCCMYDTSYKEALKCHYGKFLKYEKDLLKLAKELEG